MRLTQRIRILPEETNSFEVVVRDETGYSNQYNPFGYRGNLLEVERYLFILKDLIRNKEVKYEVSDTEPIQNGVPMTLKPESTWIGSTFKDSLYLVQMFTEFDIGLQGDAFKDLDFISNVAGASGVEDNYSAVIVGENVYKIVKVEGDTIYLDRPIVEDFTDFNLGFYAEQNLTLYVEIQESLIKATNKLTDCCNNDSELINLLATIHLYLKGVKEATDRGSFETALKFLEYARSASKRLKDCKGC